MSGVLSAAASRFVAEAASVTGRSATDILDDLLGVSEKAMTTWHAQVPKLDESTVAVMQALDYALRVRNPGLQYVQRATYLGYRRPVRSDLVAGSRSEVFISFLGRRRQLVVALPLDPAPYQGFPEVRDVGEKGHHGVGDLYYEIADDDGLALFLERFDFHLRPPVGEC